VLLAARPLPSLGRVGTIQETFANHHGGQLYQQYVATYCLGSMTRAMTGPITL
jgi:hypothetical protein